MSADQQLTESTTAPTTLPEAVAATKARIAALYLEKRAARKAEVGAGDETKADELGPLYMPEDAFGGGWLPDLAGPRWSLPVTYRDKSVFADPAYVSQQLYGADLAFFERLCLQDNLVAKFALLRKLDVETAATRFLEFRRLVIEHHLTFTADDAEVQSALQLGAFHFAPRVEPTGARRPIVSMFPRKLDYDAVAVQAVKKAWFYAVMAAITWTPTAQTDGLVICNSLRRVGLAHVKVELFNFFGQGVNHAMPVRISRIFIANEPFIFGSVLWPVMKRIISDKVRGRVKVVTKEYGKVLDELPPHCVPVEAGGEWVTDTEHAVAAMVRLVAGDDEPALLAACHRGAAAKRANESTSGDTVPVEESASESQSASVDDSLDTSATQSQSVTQSDGFFSPMSASMLV